MATWTRGITLANYEIMLQYRYIGTGFRNSVTRVLLGGALNLAVCVLGAYPLSKRDLPHRTLIMGFIVFTMFFSGGLISLYLLVSNRGLRNTVWALVLPTLVPTFSLIVMRNLIMRRMVNQVRILEDLGGMNVDEMVLPETLKAATIMISTVPILMIYPFLQKYFAKGILVGSLKG